MRKHSISALSMLAAVALSSGIAPPDLRSAHRQGYRPTKPKRDTELQREIADWNAAVDARKAKKGRK